MKNICKRHGLTAYSKSHCKKCACEFVVANRIAKKKKLVELFGGKCLNCGYSKYYGALQFHHKNPKNKLFSLSVKGLSHSWVALLKEAKKCSLLCANCHAEVESKIIGV